MIQFVNRQTEGLFQYSKDELLGRPVETLVPARLRAGHAGHRLVFTAAPRAREMGADLDLRGRRKDGTEFPVEISLSPLPTDQGMTVSAAIRDVTARRKLTQQLEFTNRDLEAFAYSVAHDLRAPLRSIDGFSQVLLEDYGSVLDADGVDHLERVRAAARRMALLIDDLLSLSRVAQADLVVSDTDITEVATRIVADLRAGEPDRAAVVEIDTGLVAQADPRLAEIALRNLPGNAWKFTAGRPDATIRLTEETPGWFAVVDNGVGFDTASADRLFAAFQRLHTTTAFPGTGVGLAIVQRILRRHGGDIRGEASPGHGAKFTFTFDSTAGDRLEPLTPKDLEEET